MTNILSSGERFLASISPDYCCIEIDLGNQVRLLTGLFSVGSPFVAGRASFLAFGSNFSGPKNALVLNFLKAIG